MKVVTFTEARSSLKKTMDSVCADHQPIVVTRQRGEAVVMMSLADYNSIEETLYLTRSPANAVRLHQSIAQLEAGTVHKLALVEKGEMGETDGPENPSL